MIRSLSVLLNLWFLITPALAQSHQYLWHDGLANEAELRLTRFSTVTKKTTIGNKKIDTAIIDSITYDSLAAASRQPDNMIRLNTGQCNDMTALEKTPGTYTIYTKGYDPYIHSYNLSKPVHQDSCILTFQYRLNKQIANFKVFFGAPVSEARSAVLGNLEPSILWKTASFDIDEYRTAFKWGNSTSNFIRIDPGDKALDTLEIRNMYLRSATLDEIKARLAKEASKQYIDNGQVRLGVDMDRGGSIFYFAESSTLKNMLNHYDEGRFMQQSYYGEGDGSHWNGQNWHWNPIQGGGCDGTKAVVKSSSVTDSSITVISTPVHWAYCTLMPELEMEENITLHGNVAHIHYILRNNGANATSHPNNSQELPAVFIDAAYDHLVFYKGAKPWQNDEVLTDTIPGWPNEYHNRTEPWSAFVNSQGFGIGVYTPRTNSITAYRYLVDNNVGPKVANCSYFAPIRSFAITKGMTFEYDVYVTIGTTKEIRNTFYNIHNNY